jgi:hypothetical protein
MSYDPLELYSDQGYKRLAGTEDWITVVDIDETVSYEWTTFRGYYSPTARRYFWHGDSGHSGNDWDDAIRTVADFANGDRADLRAALRQFAQHHHREEEFNQRVPEAIAQIATFKEPQ